MQKHLKSLNDEIEQEIKEYHKKQENESNEGRVSGIVVTHRALRVRALEEPA